MVTVPQMCPSETRGHGRVLRADLCSRLVKRYLSRGLAGGRQGDGVAVRGPPVLPALALHLGSLPRGGSETSVEVAEDLGSEDQSLSIWTPMSASQEGAHGMKGALCFHLGIGMAPVHTPPWGG